MRTTGERGRRPTSCLPARTGSASESVARRRAQLPGARFPVL